jgi:hypothetical protein
MDSLRRELGAGLRPIHETFVALVRLFGSKGHATKGLEILGAMEKLNYDIRHAWMILIGIILIIMLFILRTIGNGLFICSKLVTDLLYVCVPWFGVWHVMQRNLFGTSIWKMQTKCS